MSWCTIESDPGVFKELIQLFGINDVSVEEEFDLDTLASSSQLQSYGLIFLFKYQQEDDNRLVIDPNNLPDLFFAKQVVSNACATQAILSVLLNSQDIVLSQTLQNLKDFTIAIDAESKGYSIGNSEDIRLAHNSFARPEPIIYNESNRKFAKKQDAYHFIAYVPFNDKIYELDGLKVGPILIGDVSKSNSKNWLEVVKPAIEERMQRYSSSETSFALLNICQSKIYHLKNEVIRYSTQIEELISSNENDEKVQQLHLEIENLNNELNYEYEKERIQRNENIRRRHNYIPLIMNLLHILAKRKLLDPLRENAMNRQKAKEQRDSK